MFGTPWRQSFCVCLSRWGGRHWWNSDDPWPLQRLGLDQSTAGSVTHMSTGNLPHSSAFCCLKNTIIHVKYDTNSLWNRLLFVSLCEQVCVLRRSTFVENQQQSTSSENWCTPPERKWRWGSDLLHSRMGYILYNIDDDFCSLLAGPHIPAFDSLLYPGPSCWVVGQPQTRRLHRLLQQERHLLHQQADWGQRTWVCRDLRQLTAWWVLTSIATPHVCSASASKWRQYLVTVWLPGTKLSQAKKFNDPDNPCKILVATDAIGMGLNL